MSSAADKTPLYAEVLVDLVSNAVDRPFHYSIPPGLREKVRPGQIVTVPFGPRQYQGYILRLPERAEVSRLKDITAIVDPEPLLTEEQIALMHWLSHHYFSRKIDALHAMVPTSFRLSRRSGRVELLELTEAASRELTSRAPARRRALEIMQREGPMTRKALEKEGISAAVIKAMKDKGLLTSRFALPEEQAPESVTLPSIPHALTEEQTCCFDRVVEALRSQEPLRLLLHGVTASGKTEIYMQSMHRCLEKGRSALIMVPEIALTPQMIESFEGRFPGRIAVLHSRLTPAEKSRQWQMIKSERASVVLGARSAVFAPLKNIGLVVIDEEHETTYKQEEAPRYHARDVAWWRVRYHKSVLLLGSATPSLESYYATKTGAATLLTMPSRVTPIQLPPVQVVDMRRELKENHRHIFSRPLLQELAGVLERDEQALLFINRRGFSGFVLCRECGYVVRCSSCDVSMTLHLSEQVMRCHYCNHEESAPAVCPECGGIKIRYFSAGTQRVEDEIRKLYPDLPLIRMDRDTTSSRKAHGEYYRLFRDRKASILIGTQMIAKGFDFPHVTLVGVVAADTALNLPDFRAPERTFQLLTQVSGRTARGPRGGKVIVQTYHPSHYSILAAAGHDYASFSEAELEKRRQLAYPPYTDMIRFLFSGEDERAVFEAASWMSAELEEAAGDAELLGPAPAALYRIKNQFRVQTIIKGERLSRLNPPLKKVIRSYHEYKPPWPVRLAVDFNPLVVL